MRYLIFRSVGSDTDTPAAPLTEHGRSIRTTSTLQRLERMVREPDELVRIEAAFLSFSRTMPDRPPA